MRTDDTRRAWICIGSNHKRVNIKWRSCHVGRRVWRRRVRTEKQCRDQAKISNPARKKTAAKIKRPPRNPERVTLKVAVATVYCGAIVKIGNDHDISLVISRAGFEPTFELVSIVGGAHVRIAYAPANLQTTKLV